MTVEKKNRKFQHSSKPSLLSSKSKETIESKGHIHKKKIKKRQNQNIQFTILGYCEKSDQ